MPKSQLDLSRSVTEPSREFVRFHNSFNRTVKVTSAALARLSADAAAPDGKQILQEFIKQTQQPWGEISFNNPLPIIKTSINQLSNLWIVNVFSALDLFITRTKAELFRWNNWKERMAQKSSKSMPGPDPSEGDGQGSGEWLESIYIENKWSFQTLDKLRDGLNFFRKCRNCTAHRNGLASVSLANEDTAKALVSCKVLVTNRSPEHALLTLPRIQVHTEIESEPRHAILASALCYRIAMDINRQHIHDIGIEGMAFMAAFHALMKVNAANRVNKISSAARPINCFLSGRYKVRGVNKNTATSVLKRMNYWSEVINSVKEAANAKDSSCVENCTP